jgi:eukaryotic-like serine/threonine-protein kinase
MSDEADILSRANQRIGTVLHEKYRLDAVLGIGGMAVVYAATHRNRKQLAIKVLHPEFAVRSEFRARFLREGYAANSVGHEGVAAVLDDDVDEAGTAFLVMDLLRGADVELLRMTGGGQLPVRVALSIAQQVLGVLEAAHAKGIVHRDLKPANFFVVESGQVKVLDFGVAQLRESASSIATRSGIALGTPAFMAPEQASARNSEVDARTDLWALGASLFTLLSGQFVHEAENGRQTLILAATTPARSLASAAPELPAAVVELVDRALMFDKAARWGSATAMSEALARAHRDSFGELSLDPLKTCVAGVEAARYRVSSSDAAALGKSETTAEALPPAPFRAERKPQLTTAKPVVAPSLLPLARKRRRGAWIVGLGAAALAAASLLHAARTPSSRTPAPAPLTTSMGAASLLAAPANIVTIETPSAALPAPALEAAPATQPRASLSAFPVAVAKLALSSAAPVKGLAANGAAPAPVPPTAAPPTPVAASNPLELELQ